MDHITSYNIEMNVKIIKESIQELADAIRGSMSEAAKEGAKEAKEDVKKQTKEDEKKRLAEETKQNNKIWNDIKNTTEKYLEQQIVKLIDSFVDTFKNAWKEMSSMLDYSQMTDSAIRDLKLTYGFSSAQAYGWSKAQTLTGITSEEDLYYANDQQLAEFKEAFEKYSDYYTNLAESGYFEQLEEFNYEMDNFKTEMQQQVIQFFIENKDIITSGMKAILTISSAVLNIASFMFGGNSSDVASTSDVLSKYSQTTTNSNISVSISNNNEFNNVDDSQSTTNAINSASNSIYRQIIQALQGGV